MEYAIVALLVLMQIEIVAYVWLRKRVSLQAKRPVFIDTSVLMDGRIVSIAAAGFIPDTLYIPSSVLKELQLVADGSDSDKRARARHGLEVASQLTDMKNRVRIINDTAQTGVDDSLLALAEQHGGGICTIDFNLNKVAKAQNIEVLNVHELVQQLRVNHLPGEKVSLKITQKGSDNHQGVGYMADGTMVVVDNAKSDIGKTIPVEFIRSIQTAAGRMLFAKKIDEQQPAKQAKPKNGVRQSKNTKPTKRHKKSSAEDSLLSLVAEQEK
jgi:uncharacterized protein YacL